MRCDTLILCSRMVCVCVREDVGNIVYPPVQHSQLKSVTQYLTSAQIQQLHLRSFTKKINHHNHSDIWLRVIPVPEKMHKHPLIQTHWDSSVAFVKRKHPWCFVFGVTVRYEVLNTAEGWTRVLYVLRSGSESNKRQQEEAEEQKCSWMEDWVMHWPVALIRGEKTERQSVTLNLEHTIAHHLPDDRKRSDTVLSKWWTNLLSDDLFFNKVLKTLAQKLFVLFLFT